MEKITEFLRAYFEVVLVFEIVVVVLGAWIHSLYRRRKEERKERYWIYQRPLALKIALIEKMFSEICDKIPEGERQNLIKEYSAKICPEEYDINFLDEQKSNAYAWMVWLLSGQPEKEQHKQK